MASEKVVRIAMFKFPKKEDQDGMLQKFRDLFHMAEKDGKPYILSIEAGPTVDDSNPAYNFVGKSVFKNVEDWQYYEKECQAHKSLKAKAARELECTGVMAIAFKQAFNESL